MIICHRINTIAQLKTIPTKYGVEIDVRHDNRTGKLYLNHDPGTGDDLEEYLQHYKHRFIIFNIKEAGTEQRCIDLAAKYGISKSDYFLLDVEFPYIYRASGFAYKNKILSNDPSIDKSKLVSEIAVRYSEAEPVEQALALKGLVNWVWIDVNTKLPLDADTVEQLQGFKLCLVCPERWGRPHDIPMFIAQLKDLNLELDAVMTNIKYVDNWAAGNVIKLD
jgi:hypothetical protein